MSSLGTSHFITSCGGAGYVQWGGAAGARVGNFFGDVLGRLKIKRPMGRGGGHVFRQVLRGGGCRCVPFVFLVIKSHSFLGAQTPLYANSIM